MSDGSRIEIAWRLSVLFALVVIALLLVLFGTFILRGQGTSPVMAAQSLLERLGIVFTGDEGSTGRSPECVEKLQDGGFLIHIRHAEREKWEDLTGFDALEVSQGLDGREEAWAGAVCLTEKGRNQAFLIGEGFRLAGIPVETAFTSPSCRARETCDVAFGDSCVSMKSLLHSSAFSASQDIDNDADRLREIDSLKVPLGSNIVLVGHQQPPSPFREEGGFSIIEQVNGELLVRHTFVTVADFINSFLEVEVD